MIESDGTVIIKKKKAGIVVLRQVDRSILPRLSRILSFRVASAPLSYYYIIAICIMLLHI